MARWRCVVSPRRVRVHIAARPPRCRLAASAKTKAPRRSRRKRGLPPERLGLPRRRRRKHRRVIIPELCCPELCWGRGRRRWRIIILEAGGARRKLEAVAGVGEPDLVRPDDDDDEDVYYEK